MGREVVGEGLSPHHTRFRCVWQLWPRWGAALQSSPQSWRPHGVFLCSHLKNLTSPTLWQQLMQKGAFPFLLCLGCLEDAGFPALLCSPAARALLSKPA